MWVPRSSRTRRPAAAIALVLVVALAPAARADTKSKISVQEKRLIWLEGLAREKQASVARTQDAIRSITRRLREHNAALDSLEAQYDRHENDLVDTMARHDELRSLMSAAATRAYMNGPVGMVGVVLGARTLADAGDAAHFTSLVLGRNRELAARTAHAAKEIAEVKSHVAGLIKRRASLIREVRRQQDALLDRFVDAQRELEQIAAIREEVTTLLVSLRRQARAEELARFGGTMPYGQWAEAFLGSIGAPKGRGNLVAMVAWQLAEGTLARWNPLATTWRLPGSTSFNGHGVQNYLSLEQGLEATRKTLSRPRRGYEAILSSLAQDASAMNTGRAINASAWCRGCAEGEYVVELIPIVERYYDKYAKRRA